MASKSLSTSTLSLRFMQNAHRAKQLKEVELERAEVKDDEKWEVSQEVRDSWGTARHTQSESSDVHEASYLPFLFSESDVIGNDANDNGIPFKQASGRRVFNNKGELVPLVSSSSPKDIAPTSATSTGLTTSAGRKMHSRPMSISASGSSSHLHDFEQSVKARDGRNSKSARESIFENSGVGTDLRAEARKDHATSTMAPATFLKPMGVDDPKDIKAKSTIPKSEGVIDGVRQKKKAKRERDATSGESSEANKKSKKKKRNSE